MSGPLVSPSHAWTWGFSVGGGEPVQTQGRADCNHSLSQCWITRLQMQAGEIPVSRAGQGHWFALVANWLAVADMGFGGPQEHRGGLWASRAPYRGRHFLTGVRRNAGRVSSARCAAPAAAPSTPTPWTLASASFACPFPESHNSTTVPRPSRSAFASACAAAAASCTARPTDLKSVISRGDCLPGRRPATTSPSSAWMPSGE